MIKISDSLFVQESTILSPSMSNFQQSYHSTLLSFILTPCTEVTHYLELMRYQQESVYEGFSFFCRILPWLRYVLMGSS